MSEFSISSPDFNEGDEIPKKFGYKHGNEEPSIEFNEENLTNYFALIMDDPDAMAVVGKVWVHWLEYYDGADKDQDIPHSARLHGKTDFDEIGYGGPAPPNGRHTYIFKGYFRVAFRRIVPTHYRHRANDSYAFRIHRH